jgi:urease accessory protein UreF
MPPQTQITPVPVTELAGDLAPLLERLGSPDGLAALASPAGFDGRRIKTVAGLRSFLRNYHEKILRPVELPAIQRAFFHAGRHEPRELIAFDRQLAGEPALKSFSSASRLIGRRQLQRLRPLRDERIVQRYLAAVDAGEADGWHTLVFGLTLAVYSLPLRQGLVGYAQLTTNGFIAAASRSVEISRGDAGALCDEICADLPAATEPLLARGISS